MVRENFDFRSAARKAGIPLWRVAVELGVSETTLNRWLRLPLPEDKKRRVWAILEELSNG